MSFNNLFAEAVVGFFFAAALVVSVAIAPLTPGPARGTLAINLAAAAAGTMTIINTKVIVRVSVGPDGA